MNLGEGSQFAIQLAIVLICLFYRAKRWYCTGYARWSRLNCSCFGFGIEPGKPAIDVMLTIPCGGGDIGNITNQWWFRCNVTNRGENASS